MEEDKNLSQQEENGVRQEGRALPEEDKPVKTPWQQQKESWYDKIPLSLKQLDIIIGICLTLLALTFIAICLDAMGIFHLFG
ncbi:MAG: hypothetical protein ACI3V4_10715 [Faecousia sp.]